MERELGRQGAQIEELQRDVKHLSEEMARMNAKLSEMHDILAQARGGWKTLVLVGGAIAALGGILYRLVGLVLHGRP